MQEFAFSLKEEYPILNHRINGKRLIYLDNACTSLKMKTAIKSEEYFLKKYGTCTGERGVYLYAQKSSELITEARNYIAKFLNALPEEIIFTSGTTDSFNTFINSFKFQKGDEIIISSLEHNSIFLPVYEITKKKRLKLKIIPLKNFQPDINKFRELITKKTKLLCITAASNLTGGIFENLSDFITIAHNNNIKVFVDAAQYITSHKIDVKKLKADAIAFSGHKLGAPFGTGILYINNNLYKYLSPFKVGGGTIQDILIKNNNIRVNYLTKNKMFEAGILNYSGIYALYKTIKKLENIGYENIRKTCKELVNYALNNLKKIKKIKIIGNNIENGNIISFYFNSKHSIYDFVFYLNNLKDYIIALRHGKMCANIAFNYTKLPDLIRISVYIYNQKKDIDVFLTKLNKFLKLYNK